MPARNNLNAESACACSQWDTACTPLVVCMYNFIQTLLLRSYVVFPPLHQPLLVLQYSPPPANMKCSALAVSFLAAIGSASAVSGGNLRRRTECKPAGDWDCAPAADEPAAHPTWIWTESPVEQIYARVPQCTNGG